MTLRRRCRLSLVLGGLLGVWAMTSAEAGQRSGEGLALEFTSGATTLRGTLVVPSGSGPFPALVFVHGSGDGPRSAFRPFAERFARDGIASLIFDKRGSGESGGSWATSSLDDLARDVVAAVETLADHRLVDRERIGLWAISQGAWVASLVSSMSNDIALAVVVTGGGAKPRETEMYAYQTRLRGAGLSDRSQAEATAVIEQYFDYLATGQGRVALEAALESARDEPWHAVLQLDARLPADQHRAAWSWVATWDPVPHVARMAFPVLILLGGQDDLTPLDLTRSAWQAGLRQAGNKDFTIQYFPTAGHGITIGGHDTGHGQERTYADGYFAAMSTWLSRRLGP